MCFLATLVSFATALFLTSASAAMTLQTIANRVHLKHHRVQVQLPGIFSDYDVLECASRQLGFLSVNLGFCRALNGLLWG